MRQVVLKDLRNSVFLLVSATIIMGGIIAPIVFSGSITAERKLVGFAIFGLLAGLLAVIAGLLDYRQKRALWNTPSTVYALDFGPKGVTARTHTNDHFLPYKETDVKIIGELATIPVKNSSRVAAETLTANLFSLTFIFHQGRRSLEVTHKLTTNKLLYQLVDLHTRFRSFAFDCKKQSPWNDPVIQEVVVFLKEQVQNQMHYGLHLIYRDHSTMMLCSFLFVALGIGALWLAFAFGLHPFKDCIAWVPLILGAVLLIVGLIQLCSVIKDKRTAKILKQLRKN